MRRLISLIIFLSICNLCLANESRFKDLPDKHWAESSVYALVNLGVVTGFPDGTYRGLKNMTRYEMAAFLSKLSEKSINLAGIEKLVAELKTELQTTKYQIENPEDVKISTQFEERFRLCNQLLNTAGPHGPRLDYRLKLTAAKNFSQTKYLKINFDTVDAGFNGGTRDFATKMIDIEGKMKLGVFDLKATAGPGTISHIESEDYYIYSRPKNTINLSTSTGNLDLLFSFAARKVQPSGEVGMSEITSTVAYTYKALPLLEKTKISLTPRYLWSNGDKDVRGEIQLNSNPLPALSGELLFGIGNTQSSHGLYAKGILNYSYLNTNFSIMAHKVGSDYRKTMDKYDFISLNNFNKYVLDGSVDIGLELSQKINSQLKIKFISDAVLTPDFKYGESHPGTSLTNELNIGNDYVNVFYRNYFVPSGISSTDPSMARIVSNSSDLIGINLSLQYN
jgi:hypothetical protein